MEAGNRSAQDLNFYNHELIESDIMDQELSAQDAHLQTLEIQGIPYEPGYAEQLYDPSIVEQFQGWFK